MTLAPWRVAVEWENKRGSIEGEGSSRRVLGHARGAPAEDPDLG